MRIAIVGSRDYPRPEDVTAFVAQLPPETVVISGGARGVDRRAEQAARARGLAVDSKPADWRRYGKRAGLIRNREIVKAADVVYAFWDGASTGTAHTIGLARRAGKLGGVFRPEVKEA